MSAMVDVASVEEEWRTNTRRYQTPMGGPARISYGRVCLWIRLTCGHYPLQRMVPLDSRGHYTSPTRVRCPHCPAWGASR